MAESYADYQFCLEALSPVAADSPFDSDTLWGRILSALFEGSDAEAALATRWVGELNDSLNLPVSNWKPPVLISEGFQCDIRGTPWLPLPLVTKLVLERKVSAQGNLGRKDIKKINRLPLPMFSEVCKGTEPLVEELLKLHDQEPSNAPVLQPHLAMNRASNSGVDGSLHMVACKNYSLSPKPNEKETVLKSGKTQPLETAFFLRLRQGENSGLIQSALQRVCRDGWGKAKSRGLGQICFKSFEVWQPPGFQDQPRAFVSLSHFCPAKTDPAHGYWKLQAKHPVPAQFIDGRRVTLGEESKWAVKSFIRLCAGSCFRLLDEDRMQDHYGRILTDLLNPALDANGHQLPPLFHYALAFPWPIHWPEEIGKNG